MKKEFVKQTLIVALIALSGFSYSQEAYVLKYNFVKGKTYLQNTQITQNTTQTMGGREIKILTEVKYGTEFAVENVGNDGSGTVLLSLSSVSVHSSNPGMDTTMNYTDLKDKSRVVFSVTGKSLSSEKVDSSGVSTVVSQLDLGRLKILPDKSAKVGEKWQDQTVDNRKATSGNPFTMEIKSDMEYTLTGKEIKDGTEFLKISYSGTITVNGKGTQMGMEMFIEGTGKSEGFSYFEPKTSLVGYSEDNTEMNLNVAVSGQQNMTIPMTQTIKSVTTFEEKK
jgi:hypothetical protein